MEGDDAVDRSICCRRQLSADSRRSNGKPGIVDVAVGRALRWRLRRDNLTFYLLEWIYFGINKLENPATTRVCFM